MALIPLADYLRQVQRRSGAIPARADRSLVPIGAYLGTEPVIPMVPVGRTEDGVSRFAPAGLDLGAAFRRAGVTVGGGAARIPVTPFSGYATPGTEPLIRPATADATMPFRRTAGFAALPWSAAETVRRARDVPASAPLSGVERAANVAAGLGSAALIPLNIMAEAPAPARALGAASGTAGLVRAASRIPAAAQAVPGLETAGKFAGYAAPALQVGSGLYEAFAGGPGQGRAALTIASAALPLPLNIVVPLASGFGFLGKAGEAGYYRETVTAPYRGAPVEGRGRAAAPVGAVLIPNTSVTDRPQWVTGIHRFIPPELSGYGATATDQWGNTYNWDGQRGAWVRALPEEEIAYRARDILAAQPSGTSRGLEAAVRSIRALEGTPYVREAGPAGQLSVQRALEQARLQASPTGTAEFAPPLPPSSTQQAHEQAKQQNEVVARQIADQAAQAAGVNPSAVAAQVARGEPLDRAIELTRIAEANNLIPTY